MAAKNAENIVEKIIARPRDVFLTGFICLSWILIARSPEDTFAVGFGREFVGGLDERFPNRIHIWRVMGNIN